MFRALMAASQSMAANGGAVAGDAGDEPAGEGVAVQERAVAAAQLGACFEWARPAARARRAMVGWSAVIGASGGQGCGGDVAVGGDAEVDGFGAACGGQVGLGEFAGGGVEADAESFGFAGPAFAFCFGDAGQEVVADFLEAVALGGVDAEERAADAPLTDPSAMFPQFTAGF
jgi:hypothetical protein